MTDVRDNTPLVLGTEKIGKLLMQYAIPAIIAMTASSLYNMVDSIFIGHGVGPLAIAGLAITFPLMNLAAAFGSLVGVGASTLVAIKLGQKDKESATHVLGNVVLLNAIIGLIFMTVALVFLNPILLFFGASPDTLPYAREYMEVILAGNLITHIYMGLNEVLRASGYPRKAMTATLMAVIVNCVLDALFILVFEWGIRGAALATIMAQVISLSWQLHHFFDKKSFLHFQRGIFGLKRHIVGGMLAIGLSPFLMNLCACFVVILINKSLKAHGGDLAIGAYGIVNRVVFLFIMIVMGFNQGMQPIAGYNFGARQFDRLIQVLKYTIFCGVTVTTIGFLSGQLFPRSIVYLFTTDAELIRIAVEGLRIVVIFFPVVGFQMVTSSFFQSIGMAKKAIFLSLTRQLLFLIPSLLILPNFFGTDGVWMSMPVADAIATIVAALMLRWQLKHLKV
ncbi:MATE family efflux transporter [Butyricimonas synergistica]|uniref:MATE family efflux transporter n=1 Tax=Butyricimonas synergistica TaxID=544644 RepID=UPI000361C30C|nr:MATE family efflux transporter [Butyricimonas synergistica]